MPSDPKWIEEEAHRFCSSGGCNCGCPDIGVGVIHEPGCGEPTPAEVEPVVALLTRVVARAAEEAHESLRLAVLEEACRAVCDYCREGQALIDGQHDLGTYPQCDVCGVCPAEFGGKCAACDAKEYGDFDPAIHKTDPVSPLRRIVPCSGTPIRALAGTSPGPVEGADAGVVARAEARAEREEREKLTTLAGALVKDMTALIKESEGVAGLHFNGDLAPWEELVAGGRYEGWLGSLAPLAAALTPDKKGLDRE